MELEIIGLDVLGADRVVAIDVDPVAVAKSQGAVASFAASAMPETISDKVYDKMVEEIRSALQAKNINADVRVVNKSHLGGPPARSTELRAIGVGVGIGVVGTVLGKIVWKLITGGRG